MNIGQLRHRVEVYHKVPGKTEFGENTYTYEKLCDIWADIKPISGREESMEGDSLRQNITHRFFVRKGAIKKPRNDMYFMYQGQRYDVMYSMPYYKLNGFVEFYCKLIIKGDKDYGRY